MCEDFCLIHGYEHMRKRSVFDKITYCEACEEEANRAAREPRHQGEDLCPPQQSE